MPISVVIRPKNKLFSNLSTFKLVAMPISDGIEPIRLLVYKNRFSRWGKEIISIGIVPDKWLRVMDSVCNDSKCTNSVGKLPMTLLLSAAKLLT